MITVYRVVWDYYDAGEYDSMWLRQEDAERRLAELKSGDGFSSRQWREYGDIEEEDVFESWEEGHRNGTD